MATATRTSKRAIGLERENKNSARFCNFFAITAQLRRQNAEFNVLWRTQIGDDEFFVLFLSLSAVATKSTSGKFAYISHCQRTGISATKIEKKKTPIQFKRDVFAAIAVVHAKTPHYHPPTENK